MRNIDAVINAMLAALPDDELELKRLLLSVKRAAGFTAPECMSIRWAQLVDVFNIWIFNSPDPAHWRREHAPEWAREAGEILAGERS